MTARVWYTSDTHFGHARAAEFRGFDSVDEHDATIINNWNSVVAPGDTVFHLGDVTLSSRYLDRIWMLNGHIHLIAGNHDKVFPGDRQAHKNHAKWLLHFESIQAFARRKVDGVEFLLSHFPYSGEREGPDRYSQYRLRDEGMLLVHGHLHTGEQANLPARPRQLHVGLDAWDLAPVSQETVVAKLGWVQAWDASKPSLADALRASLVAAKHSKPGCVTAGAFIETDPDLPFDHCE
jgi:calcineurin-like phosphoesterase family protein